MRSQASTEGFIILWALQLAKLKHMTIIAVINVVGIFFNIIGSILLAVSLSKYLTFMHGALAIHDMQLESIIQQKREILKADVGKLLTKGVKSSYARTTAGLILIIVGFVFQAIPYVITLLRK